MKRRTIGLLFLMILFPVMARALTLPVLVTETERDDEGRIRRQVIREDVSLELDIRTSGEFRYLLLEDGTASIVAWDGSGTDLALPDKVDGHTVTELGVKGYRLLRPVVTSAVTSLSFPNGLRAIRAGSIALGDRRSFSVPEGVEILEAFAEAANYDLRSLKLPASLRTLGTRALAFFMKLDRVILPEGLEEIGEEAFYRSEVRVVKLPGTLKTIRPYAFFDCRNLEECPGEVIRGLEEIGESAFENCEGLTKAILPASLRELGPRAYAGCSRLHTVYFQDGRLESIPDFAFEGDVWLGRLRLPEGVKAIGKGAFEGCRRLKEITLPESLQSVQASALTGLPENAVFTVKKGSPLAESLRRAGFQVREEK